MGAWTQLVFKGRAASPGIPGFFRAGAGALQGWEGQGALEVWSYQPIPGPSPISPSWGCESVHRTLKQSWVLVLASPLTLTFHGPPALPSRSGNAHSAGSDGCSHLPPQMEDLRMAPASLPTQGTVPTFTSAFQRRAGGVLVVSQLQSFLELAYRVLRYLAEP